MNSNAGFSIPVIRETRGPKLGHPNEMVNASQERMSDESLLSKEKNSESQDLHIQSNTPVLQKESFSQRKENSNAEMEIVELKKQDKPQQKPGLLSKITNPFNLASIPQNIKELAVKFVEKLKEFASFQPKNDSFSLLSTLANDPTQTHEKNNSTFTFVIFSIHFFLPFIRQ